MASDRADIPWLLGGCVLAVGLSVSAAGMILRGNDWPIVNGADHLQIFARPAQLHDERVRAAQLTPLSPAVDFTPTASITARPVSAAPPASAPSKTQAVKSPLPSPGYLLVSAARGRATFRGPAGDIVVKRGEAVPGLGRVADIAWREGGWTVVLHGASDTAR